MQAFVESNYVHVLTVRMRIRKIVAHGQYLQHVPAQTKNPAPKTGRPLKNRSVRARGLGYKSGCSLPWPVCFFHIGGACG